MNKLLSILIITAIGLTGCNNNGKSNEVTESLKEGFDNKVYIYLQGETFNAKRMLLQKSKNNDIEFITLITSDYTDYDRNNSNEEQPLGNAFGFTVHESTFNTLILTIKASANPSFTKKEFDKYIKTWNYTHLSTEAQSGDNDFIIFIDPKGRDFICLQTSYNFKYALCWKSYEAIKLSTQLQEMKLNAK